MPSWLCLIKIIFRLFSGQDQVLIVVKCSLMSDYGHLIPENSNQDFSIINERD